MNSKETTGTQEARITSSDRASGVQLSENQTHSRSSGDNNGNAVTASTQSQGLAVPMGTGEYRQQGTVAGAMPALHSSTMSSPLPEKPTVLLMLSGAEDISMLLRSHVENAILNNGLRLISPAEIPVLREKMQMGDIPFSWYDIKPFVPGGEAQVLVLAKVQKTGSTTLTYFGQRSEQISANFSIRTMDMTSGDAIERTVTGIIKYTDLNMEQQFEDTIGTAVSNLGGIIEEYWQGKLGGGKKTKDTVAGQSF